MAKYNKGDKTNFKRNKAVAQDNATIISVVPIPEQSDLEQIYVIEHPTGWTPNDMRIKQYALNKNKKYLFVKESELS